MIYFKEWMGAFNYRVHRNLCTVAHFSVQFLFLSHSSIFPSHSFYNDTFYPECRKNPLNKCVTLTSRSGSSFQTPFFLKKLFLAQELLIILGRVASNSSLIVTFIWLIDNLNTKFDDFYMKLQPFSFHIFFNLNLLMHILLSRNALKTVHLDIYKFLDHLPISCS